MESRTWSWRTRYRSTAPAAALVLLALLTPKVSGNCSPGFSGSQCQVENVAVGREASQVSIADDCQWCTTCPPGVCGPKNASLAVDGDRTTDYWVGSCTHTVPDLTLPGWWQVDLGANYTIKWLTMYLWNSTTIRERLRSYMVEIDGQLCYRQTGGSVPPEVVTVTCSTALVGQRVKVTQLTPDSESRYSLTLCEVEVPVCRGPWYGENCTTACNCRDVTETCHVETGACPASGCSDGWTGSVCDVVCPNGTWGFNCSRTCGACRDSQPCQQTDGACRAGCEAGYSGVQCDTACQPGSYGPDCAGQCGPCLNGLPCNATNGACSLGCGPGWQWLDGACVVRCESQTFGQNCSESCGSCSGGVTCDHVTGSCAQGCAWGWVGSLCQDRGLPDYMIVIIAVASFLGLSLAVGVLICNCRGRRKRAARDKTAPNSPLTFYDANDINPYSVTARIGDVYPAYAAQPRASYPARTDDVLHAYYAGQPRRASYTNYELDRRESFRSTGDNWSGVEGRGSNRSSLKSVTGDRPWGEYALPRLKVMTHF